MNSTNSNAAATDIAAPLANPAAPGPELSGGGSAGTPSLADMIAQQKRVLDELLRKQREEGDVETQQRRAMVEEFIKKLGANNLQEAIVMMRNLFAPPKGRRMTANTKEQIDMAIKNGASAKDIKLHFGLSSAAYYLRKRKLGLTKPIPRKIQLPAIPVRSYRSRRRAI